MSTRTIVSTCVAIAVFYAALYLLLRNRPDWFWTAREPILAVGIVVLFVLVWWATKEEE